MRLVDLSGIRFGRLTVVGRFGIGSGGQLTWRCVCDCGSATVTRGALLKSGNTRSCGCLRVDKTKESKTTHGGRDLPEYRIWRHMRTRCENRNDPAFKWYGGRGIAIADRWLTFYGFYEDMGPRPSPLHSLDRIDTNGHYSPENCRWATMTQQQRNRRNNRVMTFNGVTAPLSELCEINGCKYQTVRARLEKGAPIEVAMRPGSLPRGKGNALNKTVERLMKGEP